MFLNPIYRTSPIWLQESLIAWRSWFRNRLREGDRFHQRCQDVRQTQWYSPDEIARFQERMLKDLLKHATARVPYYRERLDEYGRDFSGSALNILRCMPCISKNDVLRERKRLVARYYGGMRVPISTSGSTGTPLQLVQDLNAVIRENAFLWRQLEWAGFRRGERRAWVRGDMVVSVENRQPPYWRFNRTDNMLMVSSYHLGVATAPDYITALTDFDPCLIQAYPSSIAYLARFMESQGTKYPGASLRAIVTSSETLTEADRSLVETTFGCRVFDQYGNGERVALIQTCEEGNRHLALDYSIVELFGNDAGAFEMIGTGLNNWLMPLIRYRTGDAIELSAVSCACGRAFPVVKTILGRADDYIKTLDGRRLGRLDHIFKGVRYIAESQIVQNKLGEIVVRVVPLQGFSDTEQEQIAKNARLRIGGETEIAIEKVETIPRGPNGKFRAVVCNI